MCDFYQLISDPGMLKCRASGDFLGQQTHINRDIGADFYCSVMGRRCRELQINISYASMQQYYNDVCCNMAWAESGPEAIKRDRIKLLNEKLTYNLDSPGVGI